MYTLFVCFIIGMVLRKQYFTFNASPKEASCVSERYLTLLLFSLPPSHIGAFVDWLCSHSYVWSGSLHRLDHPSLCTRAQANWSVIKSIVHMLHSAPLHKFSYLNNVMFWIPPGLSFNLYDARKKPVSP